MIYYKSKKKMKGKVSILINRKKEIKQKGFSIAMASDTRTTDLPYNNVDFSKIKVGAKTLEDAVLDLGSLKKVDSRMASKEYVLRAINQCDYEQMREISNFFYKTSGIYSRLCRYMAYLFVTAHSVVCDKLILSSSSYTQTGFHRHPYDWLICNNGLLAPQR